MWYHWCWCGAILTPAISDKYATCTKSKPHFESVLNFIWSYKSTLMLGIPDHWSFEVNMLMISCCLLLNLLYHTLSDFWPKNIGQEMKKCSKIPRRWSWPFSLSVMLYWQANFQHCMHTCFQCCPLVNFFCMKFNCPTQTGL